MAPPSPNFETTLWSQVGLVAREPDSTEGQRALATLCHAYWYPVYAFIRRRGKSPADAEDLTQSFFARILSSGFFARADPDRGRFRNFLLGAVRHHLSAETERECSQRRGGRAEKVSIDADYAESLFASDPTHTTDPTLAFDRSWATTVINSALETLEREQASSARPELFPALKEFLQRSAKAGEYDEIARRFSMTRGAVAASVHRLNTRFGEIVRRQVRDTVIDPAMAEDELQFLLRALRP